eukprot:g18361.t1
MSSDDGHMSDYDFVDLQETNVYSSDDDSTVTSSLAPPEGWSTLSLSDADAAAVAAAKSEPVVVTSATRVRREFISAVPVSPSAVAQRGATSTVFEPAGGNSSSQQVSGCLECSVCQRLLRDCVECPKCHSLFCRNHLRVDSNGKSPCPCEPCRSAASTASQKETSVAPTAAAATTIAFATPVQQPLHPASSFLPNIPVQRMADAVPSRCDGCGLSLSWGELGSHFCDQQLVSCDGCDWFGKRHLLEHHASTCAGKELVARAQHEALAARAEADLARRERDGAERRASSAEMRASELEARLLQAEKSLQHKIEEAAAIEVRHMKKEEELQQQVREAKAEVAKLAADAVKRAEAAAAAATAATAEPARRSAAASRTSNSGGSQPAAGRPKGAGAAAGTTAPLGFAAMLNRAGFPAPTAPEHAGAAAGKKAAPPAEPAATQATQTAAPPATSRAGGRSSSSSSSSSKGAPHAAVQTARVERSSGKGSGMTMTDTACQAPVPSVEACLKPYLDRPSSLLEKKVVVFWPRQGRWYIGRPTVYKEATKEHRVEYDDGDVRDHVLAHRSWGLIG